AVGTRVGTVGTRIGTRGGGARPRGAERPAVFGDPRERRAGQRVLVERLRERPALRHRRGDPTGPAAGGGRAPGAGAGPGGGAPRTSGAYPPAGCGRLRPGSGAGSRGGAPIGR